jgi:superfamily II DNA or RNA helicase
MNDVDVYGNVICKVPAPELVNGGFILPPKVVVRELPEAIHGNIAERDCNNLYATITEQKINKVLICASATKHIVGLVSQSKFVQQMQDLDYSVMYITAKTGAVIDGEKVDREVFFKTLSAWGKDDSKKFVVLHHSILSEGINVSGLEGVIFMRNMDYINFSQTIGRVIRLHHKDAQDLQDGKITPGDVQSYHKSFGLLVVPVFSQVGIHTAKKLQAVVDTIFEKGEPAISVTKR